MFKFEKSKLEQIIKKLKDASVLVVGDLAIDEMIYGNTERISREAPVLILIHSNTKVILGAASNAAHNFLSMGAISRIMSTGNWSKLFGVWWVGP